MSVTTASVQRAVNKFRSKYLKGVPPIDVDGETGPLTKAAIIDCKFYLGYGKTDARTTREFLDRLAHPHDPRLFGPGMLARSFSRRRKQRKGSGVLRLRALHVAQTLVGIVEQGGNNTGPMVDKIIHENGGDIGEPWCGDTVAYCYRHAGSKAVTRSWAMAWATGGRRRISSPLPGDIVEYTFQHTGIVERVLSSGEIQVIEGNTGSSGAVSDSSSGHDGVKRKVRSTGLVRGYYRVSR